MAVGVILVLKNAGRQKRSKHGVEKGVRVKLLNPLIPPDPTPEAAYAEAQIHVVLLVSAKALDIGFRLVEMVEMPLFL